MNEADTIGGIVRSGSVDILELWIDAVDEAVVEWGLDNPRGAIAAVTLVVDGARRFIEAERQPATEM